MRLFLLVFPLSYGQVTPYDSGFGIQVRGKMVKKTKNRKTSAI